MAKNTITRATALTTAIDLMTERGMTAEVEVLSKMLASITKPRAKSTSKAALRNAGIAREVLTAMPEGVALTVAEVGSLSSGFNVNPDTGKVSSQHVAAVMKMLIDSGNVARAKVGKTTVYTRV